jgi:hypothetical protein
MPSSRRLRLRLTLLLAALAIFATIYVTSAPHSTRRSPFYTRTEESLAQHERKISSDGAAVQQRLQDAERAAIKAAEVKAEEFHGEEGRRKAEEAVRKAEAAAGAHVVVVGDRVVAGEERAEEKAVEELGYILKRGPGKSALGCMRTRLTLGSDHFFQVVLSALQKGQEHPPQPLHHHAAAGRDRAGHARAGGRGAGGAGAEHGQEDGAERAGKWHVNWRRR